MSSIERTPIVLSSDEFAKLPEYSCSLPTGTTVGRRWKCNVNAFRRPDPELDQVDPLTGAKLSLPAEWWHGEFVPSSVPKTIGIEWHPIVVKG